MRELSTFYLNNNIQFIMYLNSIYINRIDSLYCLFNIFNFRVSLCTFLHKTKIMEENMNLKYLLLFVYFVQVLNCCYGHGKLSYILFDRI